MPIYSEPGGLVHPGVGSLAVELGQVDRMPMALGKALGPSSSVILRGEYEDLLGTPVGTPLGTAFGTPLS